MPFKKGNVWGNKNKGRKPSPKAIEMSVKKRKGKKLSLEHAGKIREALKGRKITWNSKLSESAKGNKNSGEGKSHSAWKGEFVGYNAMHSWVRRCKGIPLVCEKCGTNKAKRFEWANIDHKYRRVLDNYVSMCPSCHKKYDKELRLNQ